jgi:DNA (cytosine-5)-methyltransferase 1
MMKIIETFSGMGAQAKAMKRLGIQFEISAISEWDITAIIAYDLIHNGPQKMERFNNLSKDELLNHLENYTLSNNGKEPCNKGSLRRINEQVLRHLLYAINRCNNLVSITDIKGTDIPEDTDLLTYSFPCQDLSIANVWHGDMSGINRDANNRSGMLWEVERILKECVEEKRTLPKFLLMENVRNLTSKRHKNNFNEWIEYLKSIGYFCKTYCLNAKKFGVPQSRSRIYMISIYTGGNHKKNNLLKDYFEKFDLEDESYVKSLSLREISIKEIIRNDYSIEKYKKEAEISLLNDTPSRADIVKDNDKIYNEGCYQPFLKTLTTKQDRNPNTGVIEYKNSIAGKLDYRYLTARECFLAMGFDEKDYDVLIDNNFMAAKNRLFFTENKLIKMAGNSIVVNVLEAVFKQIIDIKKILE